MNDPIERLRAVAAAHEPDTTADARGLVRRAHVRRWQRGGTAGTVAACAVAMVTLLGGASGPQTLGVTTPPLTSTGSPEPTPEQSGTPTAEPHPTGGPVDLVRPSHEPGGESPEPEPSGGAPSASGTPSRSGRPRTPVGPAPYYNQSYEAGAANRYCPSDSNGGNAAAAVFGAYCSSYSYDLPAKRGGTFVVDFALCVQSGRDAQDQVFPTEQETDVRISEHMDPRPTVYTWSHHRTFQAVPHTRRLAAGDCMSYVWHLALADDAGVPLVSGREYELQVDYLANTGSGTRTVSPRFVVRAP